MHQRDFPDRSFDRTLDRAQRAWCVAAALLLAACASVPPPAAPPPPAPGAPAAPAPVGPPPVVLQDVPSRPSLGLLSRIRAPDDAEPAFELAATGVQIFRCESDKDGYRWAFKLPEAELRDTRGEVVAHHGANYSFEHNDGSRLLGTIVGYDSAPQSDALVWLLLRTQSYGQGAFDKVTYVQRVDTTGGLPPAGCGADQLGQILRVPFTAKFVFYRPR